MSLTNRQTQQGTKAKNATMTREEKINYLIDKLVTMGIIALADEQPPEERPEDAMRGGRPQMIEKQETPELITPEEAAALAKRAGTIDDCSRAEAIKEAFMQNFPAEAIAQDRRFYEFWALGAIYAAGRMQGIREQRATKKKK